jgi:catechol 2,3-dioxygenase-like lactoylglutathione lyase family enzyme
MVRFAQVFLMSADIGESRAFYEGVLGLEPRDPSGTSVAYETGACELKLQADIEPEALAEYGLSPPGGQRGEGAVFVLAVDERLDSRYGTVREQLRAGPGEVLAEPHEVPWGGRMFLLCDPDGYVIEVREAERQ